MHVNTLNSQMKLDAFKSVKIIRSAWQPSSHHLLKRFTMMWRIKPWLFRGNQRLEGVVFSLSVRQTELMESSTNHHPADLSLPALFRLNQGCS